MEPGSASGRELPEAPRRVVVIGGSAGAIRLLRALLARLPVDFPAPILVVTHVSAEAPDARVELLSRAGALRAVYARDGEVPRAGVVYVGPPGRHLVITGDGLRLTTGPRENRFRPAIDPLFRSSAVHYGPASVGVMLSGYLDDGVAGMEAVQRAGGATVVIDPDVVQHGDLPRNVLTALTPDARVPTDGLAPALEDLVRTPIPGSRHAPPEDLVVENDIAQAVRSDMPADFEIGELAPVACPECHGPLWRMKHGRATRYRCHVGHGYGARSLAAAQGQAIEASLWAGLRALREQALTHQDIASGEAARGYEDSASAHEELAAASREHARTLQHLLDAVLDGRRPLADLPQSKPDRSSPPQPLESDETP